MPSDIEKGENAVPLLDVEAQKSEFVDEREHEATAAAEAVPASPLPNSGAGRKFLIWTVINMLATIGIVFTNKAIFNDPDFKLMQTSFACFHFLCTGLTLYIVSRPGIAAFTPKRAAVRDMLPLALSMCLNVVLPNFSLAFSSVTVYQLCRVLLTPMTAVVNYVFYGATIPRNAALVLIPVCLGVGVTSYYDTKSNTPAGAAQPVSTTSSIGVFFALSGVCASAAYTVLIGAFHKKLNMSSSQLLLNQAPISSAMLLVAVPFIDRIPNLGAVPSYRWFMIIISGVFAALINISQFFIVAGSGAVSSTVVGHLKTVSIVSLGWAFSGRGVNDMGLLGIFMTVGGIIGYSYIMLNQRK